MCCCVAPSATEARNALYRRGFFDGGGGTYRRYKPAPAVGRPPSSTAVASGCVLSANKAAVSPFSARAFPLLLFSTSPFYFPPSQALAFFGFHSLFENPSRDLLVPIIHSTPAPARLRGLLQKADTHYTEDKFTIMPSC